MKNRTVIINNNMEYLTANRVNLVNYLNNIKLLSNITST